MDDIRRWWRRPVCRRRVWIYFPYVKRLLMFFALLSCFYITWSILRPHLYSKRIFTCVRFNSVVWIGSLFSVSFLIYDWFHHFLCLPISFPCHFRSRQKKGQQIVICIGENSFVILVNIFCFFKLMLMQLGRVFLKSCNRRWKYCDFWFFPRMGIYWTRKKHITSSFIRGRHRFSDLAHVLTVVVFSRSFSFLFLVSKFYPARRSWLVKHSKMLTTKERKGSFCWYKKLHGNIPAN